MYICICHALNDKKVKVALSSGATTPASVFRHYECQVQCGKCVPMMRAMADDHRTAPVGACIACPSQHASHAANNDAAAPAYGIAAE